VYLYTFCCQSPDFKVHINDSAVIRRERNVKRNDMNVLEGQSAVFSAKGRRIYAGLFLYILLFQ
jgi:hypothetical protein